MQKMGWFGAVQERILAVTSVTSHPPLTRQPISNLYISNHAHVLTQKRSNFILP